MDNMITTFRNLTEQHYLIQPVDGIDNTTHCSELHVKIRRAGRDFIVCK